MLLSLIVVEQIWVNTEVSFMCGTVDQLRINIFISSDVAYILCSTGKYAVAKI